MVCQVSGPGRRARSCQAMKRGNDRGPPRPGPRGARLAGAPREGHRPRKTQAWPRETGSGQMMHPRTRKAEGPLMHASESGVRAFGHAQQQVDMSPPPRIRHLVRPYESWHDSTAETRAARCHAGVPATQGPVPRGAPPRRGPCHAGPHHAASHERRPTLDSVKPPSDPDRQRRRSRSSDVRWRDQHAARTIEASNRPSRRARLLTDVDLPLSRASVFHSTASGVVDRSDRTVVDRRCDALRVSWTHRRPRSLWPVPGCRCRLRKPRPCQPDPRRRWPADSSVSLASCGSTPSGRRADREHATRPVQAGAGPRARGS